MPERLFGQATRLTTAWGTYILAIGAPIVGWIQFREQLASLDLGPLDAWKLPIIFGLPLVIAGSKVIVDLHGRRIKQRRRLWAAKGPPIPGYFRLTSYQAGDRERFARADGVHERVLAWLQGVDSPLLYLTGRSGCGKSSILNAYVVPALIGAPTNARVVEARAFGDPLSDFAEALVSPGVIWSRPPQDAGDLWSLLQRALQHLDGGRLILILDQFEEFVILHEQDAARAPLRAFLDAILNEPIPGLTVLLVLREDYLRPTRDALGLPIPELEKNWEQVPLFVHGAADRFLRQSHEGGLDAELVGLVLEEAADIEDNPGLYRPITLNMLGLVIAETTGRSRAVAPDQVLRDYLRRRLRDPLVREFAPEILRWMVTRFRTKRPLTESEIETAAGFPRLDVEGTLVRLEAAGLVRRLEHGDGRRWEISHDFVARLLAIVLAGWRETVLWTLRPWLAPALVVVWLVTLAVGAPIYIGRNHDQAAAALSQHNIGVARDPQMPERLTVTATSADGELWSDGDFFWRHLARLDGTVVTLNLFGAHQLTDLGPIAGHRDLRVLDLRNAGRLADLSPLAGLTELRSLDLSFAASVTDLAPLGGLTNLQTLNLREVDGVTDLGPLAGLSNLETLYLGNADGITDLGPLAGLTNLQTLDLGEADGVKDLGPLAGLTNLQRLILNDTEVVSGLGPLAGLTSLRALDLSEAEGVRDLGPLAGLTNLQTLDLSEAQGVTDLGPLAGLTNLQSLNLHDAVGVTDLKPIAGLTKLQRLFLGDAEHVTDIGPLSGLTNLLELDLGDVDGVADLGPLAGLVNLRTLDLSEADGVTDLGPLAGLSNLRTLDLSEAEGVTDLGPLFALTGLRRLGLLDMTGVASSEIERLKSASPGLSVAD